jgi:glycosyltransferase involved in cell wall biosynthesis
LPILLGIAKDYRWRLVEAGEKGLAVITTNVGAISELIDDQKGILVQSKDEQAFKTGLQQLIISRDLRVKLGSNLSNFTQQNFTWKRAADLVLQQLH